MKIPFRTPIAFLTLCSILFANAVVAADSFELPTLEEEADLSGEGALRRYDGYVNKWKSLRSAW